MIEQRGLPLHAGVAFGATRNVSRGELLSVNVLVAVLALCRRRLEVHIHELGFKVGRLVAIDTSRGTMRTQQDKLCPGVVEAR